MNNMNGNPTKINGSAMMAERGKMSNAGSNRKCESVNGCNNSASMSRCFAGGILRLRAISSRFCENEATWCPESTI